MIIGITGDTHGNVKIIEKLASQGFMVEQWLHTGDFAKDALLLAQKSGVPTITVTGNNDVPSSQAECDQVLTLLGTKIWLTHGHRYLARGKTSLLNKAQELNASIIVYGHTHVPEIIFYQEFLLINPGSPAYPRAGSKAGFVLLELIEKQEPKANFIALTN